MRWLQGNVGWIEVATNFGDGRLMYGMGMNSSFENYGLWLVTEFVNGVQLNSKRERYPPHGSQPPENVPVGSVYSLRVTHFYMRLTWTWYFDPFGAEGNWGALEANFDTGARHPGVLWTAGRLSVFSIRGECVPELDLVRLADALAIRANEVVPDSLVVWAEGHTVVFGRRGWGEDGRIVILAQQRELHSHISLMARNVLNVLQDYVARETKQPWPPLPSGGGGMLEPHSEIRNETVYCWYGAESGSALGLRPLPLADVLR